MKITGFIYNGVVYLRLRDAINAVPDEDMNQVTKSYVIRAFFYSNDKHLKVNNLHYLNKDDERVFIQPISIKLKPQVVTALSNGDYYIVDNQAYLGVKRFKELELMD